MTFNDLRFFAPGDGDPIQDVSSSHCVLGESRGCILQKGQGKQICDNRLCKSKTIDFPRIAVTTSGHQAPQFLPPPSVKTVSIRTLRQCFPPTKCRFWHLLWSCWARRRNNQRPSSVVDWSFVLPNNSIINAGNGTS